MSEGRNLNREEAVITPFEVTDDDVRNASLRCAEHAEGQEDLRELLLMLGLIPNPNDPESQLPAIKVKLRGGLRVANSR